MGGRGTVWRGEELDLDGYLRRLGLAEAPAATLEGLAEIQYAQVTSIPFENLEIVLGRTIPLELDALERKLVRSARGGYCYEHNSLFAAALERLGFEVEALGARVAMGSGKLRAVTHALLRVRIDGVWYLADSGFGGHAVLTPVELREGATASRDGLTYRVAERDGRWVLFEEQLDLYEFDAVPVHPVDFAVYNYYIGTHPHSPFTGRLVVQRPDAERRRLSLVDDEFTQEWRDGARTTRRIEPEETPKLLSAEFGIELGEADAAALVEFQREWRKRRQA